MLAVAAVGVGVGACGKDEGDTATVPSEPAAPATSVPSETATTATETAPARTVTAAPPAGGRLTISKDLSKKPAIPKPTGTPPSKLVVQDVVKGSGPSAKSGDPVQVQYVLASFATGQELEASWDGGQPFSFPLGGGQVIPGWDQGVVGMKKGGRRTLIIPPDLAYGPTGQGSIGPNETLVFVIDLLKVGG